MDKQQRDYMLNQQLKTIQDELGGGPHDNEIRELEEKSKKKKWSKEVANTFKSELQKLQRMNPSAAEHSIQLNYLDVFVELPWEEFTKDKLDLKRAEKILNEDHYGLEEPKERILEYLAVLKLKGKIRGQVICFVGPPGVGKTSLARSIARALGRKFVRISLGGVRDEAEIRGHRRTYVGALPGRIIRGLHNVGTNNPVFMLDEIDKIASREGVHGPEVSREGVQRDILPIVEGSTINTKHGAIKTDHILFVAAGAFHMAKPSDLIPELQGRFPIRVELNSLDEDDFYRILTEPKNALIRQYKELMKTESIDLDFDEDAIREMAKIAKTVNERTENIGARRLHTILEKLLEELSFTAPELAEKQVRMTADEVRRRLVEISQDEDLSRYIL